jgi:hypothetical protein
MSVLITRAMAAMKTAAVMEAMKTAAVIGAQMSAGSMTQLEPGLGVEPDTADSEESGLQLFALWTGPKVAAESACPSESWCPKRPTHRRARSDPCS